MGKLRLFCHNEIITTHHSSAIISAAAQTGPILYLLITVTPGKSLELQNS